MANNQHRKLTTDKPNENILETTLTTRRYPSMGNNVDGDGLSKGRRSANRIIPSAFAAVTSISLILGQAYAFENIELLDDVRQSTFPSTSSIIAVQKEELPPVSFTRNGVGDSISDASSTGKNLYVQFDTPPVAASKAITQTPEPKVIIEQTGQSVGKASKPKLTEPEVILTKQKDRRSGSYLKPNPPDLKVILENEPSPLKNKALPQPQPEITVILEKSSPKGIDPAAPVKDETSPPSQKTEPLILKSETKTDDIPPKKKLEVESIRPEAMEYIKGYNAAKNNASEKKPINIGVTKDVMKQVPDAKRSSTNIAKPKSVTSNEASINKSGIYEVLNNAKTFALGLGVGTVAIITYQKKKGILDIVEGVDYEKSTQLDDKRMSVSYLESLNMSSKELSRDVDGQNE